jgi:predicted Rossmann-fold nucleotide-binding protein
VLDVDGYWQHLELMLDRAVAEGFLRAEHRRMLMVETSATRLLDRFESYEAPALPKWIDRGEA